MPLNANHPKPPEGCHWQVSVNEHSDILVDVMLVRSNTCTIVKEKSVFATEGSVLQGMSDLSRDWQQHDAIVRNRKNLLGVYR